MAERGRPRSFDRQAALERAMDVFWERGYQAASMSDLTEAMGINSPSLYAAFGSKEELYRAAIHHFAATESDDILAPLQNEPTARAAIEGYLMASARTFTRPGRPPGCICGSSTPASPGLDRPGQCRSTAERAVSSTNAIRFPVPIRADVAASSGPAGR